ncbi:MAG: hypothetical protein NT027_16165 [Proteobacteria bacterium]|nr:hypothetical protein [Pseudomonadota bacterium]
MSMSPTISKILGPKKACLTLLSILAVSYISSCSETSMTGSAKKSKGGDDAIPTPSSTPPTNSAPEVLESVDGEGQRKLQQHKVTFAARNLSCTMCHAKIDGTVISDLFLNSNEKSEAQTISGMFHYHSKGGGGAHVEGDFMIPKGSISVYSASVANGQSNCSIAGVNNGGVTSKLYILTMFKKCLEPYYTWGKSSKKFVEKSSIKISPPNNPSEIKALYDTGKVDPSGVSLLEGAILTNVTGDSTSGYTIKGKFKCNGAVVFNAPVAIIQSDLESTAQGCRIYSTGSIYVFGGIKVPEPKATIQLLSPKYIGLDVSFGAVNNRFLGAGTPWLNHHTYSFGDYSVILASIKKEMESLKIASMGEGAYAYNKIALAAPVIFSRSKGLLSGTAVAELFIGPIGATKYAYDPIWNFDVEGIPLWPEIKTPMVEVKD